MSHNIIFSLCVVMIFVFFLYIVHIEVVRKELGRVDAGDFLLNLETGNKWKTFLFHTHGLVLVIFSCYCRILSRTKHSTIGAI